MPDIPPKLIKKRLFSTVPAPCTVEPFAVLRSTLRRGIITALRRFFRTAPHILIGKLAEAAVSRELIRKGYVIVERNWRSRFGEIDIIARRKACIIFIEVKARRRGSEFNPFDAVGHVKAQRLRKLSMVYQRRRKAMLKRLRVRTFQFDTVGVLYHFSAKPWFLRFSMIHKERFFE